MPRACSSRRAQAPSATDGLFSSGWFMYTSADREQAALDYLKELRHSDTGTPDDVLAAFATELTRNLDWIKELGAADTDLTIVPGTTDYACFPEYPELEHSAAIDYAAFTAEDSKWAPTSPSS